MTNQVETALPVWQAAANLARDLFTLLRPR